jgi:coenzyme F420-reducing hydrogenase delta subunit
MSEGFQPKLLAFLCNWCSYAGADLCGVSRYQYPPTIRIVRVMCSTRLDPVHLLEVLKAGADGVLVGGCHPGDCHYISGNYYTENKVHATQRLLERAGLESKRLRLEWVSASEGERFSKVVAEFTNEVTALGPNPVSGNEELQAALQAAIDAASSQRLRTLVGREYMITEVADVYGKKMPKDAMELAIDQAAEDEFYRNRIIRRILTEPKSVKQIAKEIKAPSDKVLQYIISLRGENRVGDAGHAGMSPLYIALQTGGE